MTEILVGMLLMTASVYGSCFGVAWGARIYLEKPFTSAWAAWTGKATSLFLILLLVGTGVRDVNRGMSDGVTAAFVLASAIAAFWPLKWLVQHWIGAAPDRAIARQQAEDRGAQQKRLREEKATKTQVEREVNTARAEVESFYKANAESLRDVLPPSLFRSELQTRFPAGIYVPDAWSAARDMISLMQPVVQKEQERQRHEQQRLAQRAEQVRKLDEEIKACEQQIERLRDSKRDPDLIEAMRDEVEELQEQIKNLQQQRELLQNTR